MPYVLRRMHAACMRLSRSCYFSCLSGVICVRLQVFRRFAMRRKLQCTFVLGGLGSIVSCLLLRCASSLFAAAAAAARVAVGAIRMAHRIQHRKYQFQFGPASWFMVVRLFLRSAPESRSSHDFDTIAYSRILFSIQFRLPFGVGEDDVVH